MDAEAHVAAKPINPMRIFSEFSRQAPENCHDRRRQRLGRQLVRPAGADARHHARHALGDAGHDGSGRAVRDRRQVRPPGPAGDRLRGRRRDADERPGRAAHDRALLPGVDATRGSSSRSSTTTTSTRSPGSCGPWAARPRFVESQALPDTSYADFAASIGLGALTVTDPEQLEDAWRQALTADRPFVLDVHCDPDVPPIPPHATLEQMTDMAAALIKGDTSRWGVIKEGLKTKAQELLPNAHDDT